MYEIGSSNVVRVSTSASGGDEARLAVFEGDNHGRFRQQQRVGRSIVVQIALVCQLMVLLVNLVNMTNRHLWCTLAEWV